MTERIQEELALRNRVSGLLLRNAREMAGKSKRECAMVLGVSSSTITAYEEGRKAVSLPELEVLAYVLDTSVADFWDRNPELEPKEKPLALDEVLALRHRIVGVLLRQARLETDMTQEDLADLLGCSASRISAYEYGERPVPLSELELLARHLHLTLEYFLDNQDGPVGEWHAQQEISRRFLELPEEVQRFVTQPINIKYLEVAMKLAQMPAGGLRAIAEGLLDITY